MNRFMRFSRSGPEMVVRGERTRHFSCAPVSRAQQPQQADVCVEGGPCGTVSVPMDELRGDRHRARGFVVVDSDSVVRLVGGLGAWSSNLVR